MAYCSSVLSLAALELIVHLDPAAIPGDLVAIELEIPDTLPIQRWTPANLPAGWREPAAMSGLRARGEGWIKAATTAVLLVPSVVVPREMNILINPAHPDAARVLVLGRTPFTLDPRLFH